MKVWFLILMLQGSEGTIGKSIGPFESLKECEHTAFFVLSRKSAHLNWVCIPNTLEVA